VSIDLQFVCDNSELNGIWGAEVPDILVIGGYAISRPQIPKLLTEVERIKTAHGLDPQCPVKWNVKDLDSALTAHVLMHQKEIILAKSNALRTELLKALAGSDAIVFASAIRAHSTNRQVLGRTKEDLIAYSFGNLLMRAGLYCKEKQATHADFLLDWPERNDRRPFVNEYYKGWRHGRSGSASSKVKYMCGALTALGFAPSSSFGAMEFEPRLQLADMVVGTVREFVSFALGKTPITSFGVQRFKALLPKFYRRSNGAIVGRGLSISPTHSDFCGAIFSGLATIRKTPPRAAST
jgi:hypothetical protein